MNDITPDLRDRRIVYVDCLAGLRLARDYGLPADAVIRTTSPAVLLSGEGPVESADDLMRAETRERCGSVLGEIVQACRDAAAAGELPEHVPTLAGLAVSAIKTLIVRGAGITAADFHQPVAIVQGHIGDIRLDRILDGSWARLFRTHPDCRRVVLPISRDEVPLHTGKERRREFLWRLRGAPVSSLVFALGRAMSAKRPSHRPTVIVYSDNELVRAAVSSLLVSSLRVRWLTAHSSRTASKTEPPTAAVMDNLRALFASRLGPLLIAPVLDTMWEAFADAFRSAWNRWFPAYRYWRDSMRDGRHGNVVALLGNIPRTDEEFAMTVAARAAGIPVINAQHGISRELTTAAEQMWFRSETALSDLFLCYGAGARKSSTANPFAIGTVTAVGLPPAMLKIGRTVFRTPGFPPVLYASTCLYGGSVNLERGAGNTDIAMATFELAMIDSVLSKLPHKVFYKSYPALRYLDPDPVLWRARQAENIELFDRPFDLRFLLADARVIVTARATSTFGWCFCANRPLVFIEIPGALPLRPDIRDLLRQACFYFDAGDPEFLSAIRNFLSRPIAAIEAEHARLSAAREKLRMTLFDIPGTSGMNARRAIEELVHAR